MTHAAMFLLRHQGGYVGTTQIPPTTGNYVSAALVVLTPTTRK
jgi:hypothetical protein